MIHPVNHDLSPNTHAMQQLQVMHPSIDCPIVIPNGDYDPLKEYNNVNGKRPYDDDVAMNKKFKVGSELSYQSLLTDIRRKETELRLLHDAYQKEIDEEREKRISIEIKIEEINRVHHQQVEGLTNTIKHNDDSMRQFQEDLSTERQLRERLEREIKQLQGST